MWILSLLRVIYGEYQEMKLITQLTDYFNFDHHFFLLDSTVDANRFINTNGFTPQTVYVRKKTEDVIEFDDLGEINSKNGFLIVASEKSDFQHNFNLLDVIESIQILQKQIKVGMFFSQNSSVQDLRKLYEWCMDDDHLITDIFAAIYPNSDAVQCFSPKCLLNSFSFNPFGMINVVNVTSSATFDDYFRSINANFHQHGLQYDGSITDDTDGNLWLTVFRLMNATFVEVENNYTDMSEAFENGIDMLNELYAVEEEADLNVYPLEMLQYVILVPEALPYSDFSAYLKNAMSGDFIIYSVVSTVTLIFVLSVLRYIKQKKILVLQSAADVFNLLMNDNGYIKYQQLVRAEAFVIVPLTFVGLIAANVILSMLQCHLTSPSSQQQMNTVEDIYNSPFPILAHGKAWKDEVVDVLSNQMKFKDWDNKIVVMKGGVRKYIERYNRTMSVLLESNAANILLRIQKRLSIKGYHNPHIQISDFLFTYKVHERFLFFDRLNEIIHRIQSAGLFDLWLRRDDAKKETRILNKNLKRLQNYEAASIEDFEFPMIIVYGWLTGFAILIFEIIWKQHSISLRRRSAL